MSISQHTTDLSSRTPHKIWFIDEITRSILAHLSRSEHSLAACARVSHALSDPALDVLWYRVSGLAPLLSFFPRSFNEIHNHTDHGTIYPQHRAIHNDEWQRFSRYARRVRRFHYHLSEGPAQRLGEHAFAALVRCATLHDTTLFPNLQELMWLQFSHSIQYLPFLSTSLRRVTINVQSTPSDSGFGHAHAPQSAHDRSGSGGAGLLSLLDSRAPCLQELSLEGIEFSALSPRHFDEQPSPGTPAVVTTAFSHLRSLHLGTVSTTPLAIIALCSSMPRLALLSLVLCRSSSSSSGWLRDLEQRRDARSLSSIETLRVAGAPTDVQDMLDAIDSPAFAAVALAVHDDSDAHPHGWVRIATHLATRPSLSSVRAEITRSGGRRGGAARELNAYVQPLLALHRLRECALVVRDSAGVDVVDADVEAMAAAWPALEVLELTVDAAPGPSLPPPPPPGIPFGGDVNASGGTGTPAVGAGRPSVGSLAAFSRRCKGLRVLQLPVSQDLSSIAAWDGHEAEEGEQCGLRFSGSGYVDYRSGLQWLWMMGVRFGKAESVVVSRFLRFWFPEVDLVPMTNAGVLY